MLEPGGTPTTCVIAASAHASALKRRLERDSTILVFSESESLDVLRLITATPPKVLALGASIVKTARGGLIISRVKDVASVDIRVLKEDDANLPLLLMRQDIALHAASTPLKTYGLRAATRYPMKTDVHVTIDGESSRLVDLSIGGAQLVVPTRIQPRQSVRLTLIEDKPGKGFRARVAWSTAELAQSVLRYRAGLAFLEPDRDAIEAFCLRNARPL